MAKLWKREESVIAQKFSKKEISGILRRQILLKPDETGLIERDGRVVGKFGPGTHTVSTLFDRDYTEVILVDVGVKSLRENLEGLWTKDDRKVNATAELKFQVVSPDKLFANLLRDQAVLTYKDLYDRISVEFLSRVITPEVKKREIDELYGNRDILERLRESIEVELKKTLAMWGLELISFSLVWGFPPEYEKYLEGRALRKDIAEEKEAEREESLKDAVKERELEAIKSRAGLSKEAMKAELEQERLKREFELQMRKKEFAEDADEAVEALKLKEINDKQKVLREARKKKLEVRD